MSIVEVTTTARTDQSHLNESQPETGTPVEAIDLTDSGTRTARVTFTITDAATACAVSRKTVTRKLGDLALHGAAKDDDGIWRIPVEALLAVGLHPGRSLPEPGSSVPAMAPLIAPTRPTPPTQSAGPEMVTVPRERWDDLRIRLARAEAEASERALALADARLALRALTAGPTGQELGSGPRPGEHPNEPGRAVTSRPDPPASGAPAGSEPILMGNPASAGPVEGAPASVTPAPAADPLAAARAFAAQNGGHVPAVPAPPARKRRWWQSR